MKNIYRSSAFRSALCCAIGLVSGLGLQAQSQDPSVRYSVLPSQLTIAGLYTRSDYEVLSASGVEQHLHLQGVSLEFDYRRFYPLEAVASVHEEFGNLLGQKLTTFAAGAGYVRRYKRYVPFAQIQAGMARTQSTGQQYLYDTPTTGSCFFLTAGSDAEIKPNWGVRGFVENQYLPFGEKGSIYWTAGAGVYYRFMSNR
jgi:hypothetical protein